MRNLFGTKHAQCGQNLLHLNIISSIRTVNGQLGRNILHSDRLCTNQLESAQQVLKMFAHYSQKAFLTTIKSTVSSKSSSTFKDLSTRLCIEKLPKIFFHLLPL